MVDYNNDGKFLHEFFEDFKYATNPDDKEEIVQAFLNRLWGTPNPRKIYDRYITYTIAEGLPEDFASMFQKYSKISYKASKTKTNNKDPWHLLRQKITNIYTHVCDSKVCIKQDYYDCLNTAKRLYYRYVKGEYSDRSVEDIEQEIKQSLLDAENLNIKYGKQKIKLPWRDYKWMVEDWIHRIFVNYIPFEENADESILMLPVELWCEDNYTIRYIGRSISGYMKNYQKDYYGIPRNKKYKRCECGNLFVSHGNNHKLCNTCKREHNIEKYRKYNQKRATTG